jgi:hypothetical protein
MDGWMAQASEGSGGRGGEVGVIPGVRKREREGAPLDFSPPPCSEEGGILIYGFRSKLCMSEWRINYQSIVSNILTTSIGKGIYPPNYL